MSTATLKAELVRAGLWVRDDDEARATFGRDESDLGDFPPDLVVLAGTTDEVSRTLRLCSRFRVPVTPVGARTGKSGGSLCPAGGVALSLSPMNRILEVRPDELIAVAQPGVITGDLARAVEAQNMFYPPDPGSLDTCTLGGNVAENAGGPRALKYGVTRDYVLALECVLPSGEVLRAGHRTIKGVTGFDLVSLCVGSEGTLGVFTEITLKLLPLPRAVVTALVTFRTVGEAAAAVGQILGEGLLPRALELLDDTALAAIARQGRVFPHSGAALIAEIDGYREEPVLAEMERLADLCAASGALESVVAVGSQRTQVWDTRRMVSPALRAFQGYKLSEDVVVPRSRLVEAISRFKEVGQRHLLTVATYGHAGDGNLHVNVLYRAPEQKPLVDVAVEEICRVALELGGTLTGEHGVGLAKRGFLPLEQSTALIDLQRRIKNSWDPEGILNPGKIFP